MPKLTAWNKLTGIHAYRLADTKKINHDEWLQYRQKGIGGSDIAAVCGLNPFMSSLEVFLQKTGRIKSVEENEKMKWGKLLEDPVAREFSSRCNNPVQKVNAILQDTEYPFFLSNIDRLILSKNNNGILEVKTTGWNTWSATSSDSDSIDTIPDMPYCQLQWYLGCSKLQWGRFATLIQGQSLITPPPIQYDSKAINNMRKIAYDFWVNHVEKDIPPDPDNNAKSKDAYRILYPLMEDQTIELSQTFDDLIRRRSILSDAINKAESEKTIIDTQILHQMKNYKRASTKNYNVLRVKRKQPYFQQTIFKEKYPELYSKYSKTKDILYLRYSENKK